MPVIQAVDLASGDDLKDDVLPDRAVILTVVPCRRGPIPGPVCHGAVEVALRPFCGAECVPAQDKKIYSVLEIADILQISKSKAYELCRQPDFKVVRLGRTIRISKVSFGNWLNNLL